MDAKFVKLGALSKKKRMILDDDLAREIYHGDVRVKASGHKE